MGLFMRIIGKIIGWFRREQADAVQSPAVHKELDEQFAEVQANLDKFGTMVRRFDETTHNGLQDLAKKATTKRIHTSKPATS